LPRLHLTSRSGAAAICEDAYYLCLSAVEIAMLLLIVGYAWRWPRQHS
jgi:hypothetical protein